VVSSPRFTDSGRNSGVPDWDIVNGVVAQKLPPRLEAQGGISGLGDFNDEVSQEALIDLLQNAVTNALSVKKTVRGKGRKRVKKDEFTGWNRFYPDEGNEMFTLTASQRKYTDSIIEIFSKYPMAFSSGETGVGKTYISTQLFVELGFDHMIVVGSSEQTWKNIALNYGVKNISFISYASFHGTKAYGMKHPFLTRTDIDDVKIPIYKPTKTLLDLIENKKIFIVFDEAQNVKNPNTTSASVSVMARSIIERSSQSRVFYLSATPFDHKKNSVTLFKTFGFMRSVKRYDYNMHTGVYNWRDHGAGEIYRRIKALLTPIDLTEQIGAVSEANPDNVEVASLMKKYVDNGKLLVYFTPERFSSFVTSLYKAGASEETISYLDNDVTEFFMTLFEVGEKFEAIVNKLDEDTREHKLKETMDLHIYNMYVEVIVPIIVRGLEKDPSGFKHNYYNLFLHLTKDEKKKYDSATSKLTGVETTNGSGEPSYIISGNVLKVAESTKIPSMIREAKRHLDAYPTSKVVFYVNNLVNVSTAMEVFDEYGVVEYSGRIKSKLQKQANVSAFQESNLNVRVFVSTILSGKESICLHDLDGNFPRYMFISPSFFFINTLQSIGRINRAKVKSDTTVYFTYGGSEPDTLEFKFLDKNSKKSEVVSDTAGDEVDAQGLKKRKYPSDFESLVVGDDGKYENIGVWTPPTESAGKKSKSKSKVAVKSKK
jgi:superfamily II DNA or RNA helicase